MQYKSNSIATQAVVLAHEVGHNMNAPHFESDKKEFVMEGRLSSGKDGFSSSSVQAIMTKLDKESCTGVDVPRVQPTPPPTKRPTPRPSPRPSPRPTPQPVGRPDGEDDGGAGSNDGCDKSRGSDEICVLKGNNDKIYVCLGHKDLLQSRFGEGGCPTRSVIVEECDGTSLLLNPSLSPAEVELVTPEFLSGSNLTNNEAKDKDGKGRKDKGKEKEKDDEDTGTAATCSRSCVIVGQFTCLLADQDGLKHSVTFSTKGDGGLSERFTTDVAVTKNKDAEGCYETTTKCS